MAVKIACDSSVDLTKEMYSDLNVSVLPFNVTLGDKTYSDGSEITSGQIFDYVEKTKVLPKTSAINEFAFDKFFKQNNSPDGLVFISISSKISSAFQNGVNASKKHKNVFMIDSLSLSTGGGLLVVYACELRDKGLSAKEIADKLNERKKYIQASFVIDKLDYLHKGGRCSSIKLLGANLLKIHPSIILKDGSMGMHKKYRGKIEKCTKEYMTETLQEFNTPCLDYCFITYSSATDEMLKSAQEVVNNFGKFKKIFYTTAGGTVTSHCGRNTIGILYFNDGDKFEE